MVPRGGVKKRKQEQPEMAQTTERKNKTERVQRNLKRPMLHMG